MLSIPIYDDIIFHEKNPYAEPLFVDANSRVLRFALKPGQSIAEHNAPHSPLHIFIIRGSGLFSGGDQKQQRFSQGMLLTFDMGEYHAVQAEDEELVFLAFMHGVPEKRKGSSSEPTPTKQAKMTWADDGGAIPPPTVETPPNS